MTLRQIVPTLSLKIVPRQSGAYEVRSQSALETGTWGALRREMSMTGNCGESEALPVSSPTRPERPTVVVAEVPQVFVLIRDEKTVGYLFDLPSGAVAILDGAREIFRSDSLDDFARFFGPLLDLHIAKVRQDL
ncbi:hypothetical protein ACN263_15765 [Micromonospora sp. WMMD729]|uniref:hypothetical protein n=1 Tax=Micromonospora sp. WMMD729 TaxID=3404127 RepID=UPI003BF4A981